ncbi:tetratricopeptide repeat protein [Candidatus Gracilibacteria bacterium]|nr:tetratricopeptide repeat protein [Candidatus Gracilibacteria bacterium]
MASQRPTQYDTVQLGVRLEHLRRQLMLVPEAVILTVLLAFYALFGAPPALALPGLLCVSWFGTRLGLLIAARQAYMEANYVRAERLAGLAHRLYAYSADVYALRGLIAQGRNRSTEAVAALKKAIVLYPQQARLHALLSGALLEDGQAQAAYAAATEALLRDSGCAAAHLHLASAEQALGANLDVVERRLRAGLNGELSAADEVALSCALATTLINAGRVHEAQFALRGVDALLTNSATPQRAEFHYYLGELHRQLGDLEAARAHYNASETLDPNGRYAAAAWRAARTGSATR